MSDLQLPARRVLVGEIVTPAHVMLQVETALFVEAMASAGRAIAQFSRVVTAARTVVVPNELDAGAIDLTPEDPTP